MIYNAPIPAMSRKSFLLSLMLLGLAAPAFGQVCKSIGDKSNLTGGATLMDLSSFDAANLKPGDNSGTPIDLRSGVKATQWMGGFLNGQWAETSGIPGGHFSNLFNNGDGQIYPNGTLLASGKVRSTVVKGADGSLTITPVKANAQELALIAASKPPIDPNVVQPTVISFAASTFPYSIAAPLFAESTVVIPQGMDNLSRIWPAWWATANDGTWGPEFDVWDGYNGAAGNVTPNMGGFTSPSNNPPNTGMGVDRGGFVLPTMKPGDTVQFLGIMYPDVTGYYVGINGAPAICVGTTLGSSSQMRGNVPVQWEFMFNYAIKANNGWPYNGSGTFSPDGPWAPLVIKTARVGSMPATYPGPGDGLTIPALSGGVVVIPPPPPPPSSPFTVAVPTSPVTQPFALTGTAGNAWVNVAAFDSNGVKVGPDTKPVSGKWSMTITGLPTGSNALSVTAFSVPAGQTGGTSTAAPALITVATPPPPATGLTAAQKAAVTQAGISLNAAQIGMTKALADYAAMRKALGVP